MDHQENSSSRPYLPWREEKYRFNITGEAMFCVTYFGEEKIPRSISFDFRELRISFPIQNPNTEESGKREG